MDSLKAEIHEDAWKELRRIFAKILIEIYNLRADDKGKGLLYEEDFPTDPSAQIEVLKEAIQIIKEPYWQSTYYQAGYHEFLEEMLNFDGGSDEDKRTYYSQELGISLESIIECLSAKDITNLKFSFDNLFDICDQLIIESTDTEGRIETCFDLLAIQETKLIYVPRQPLIYIPRLIVEAQEDLIKRIAQNPGLLFKISPRNFEEIIAEIFLKRGFETQLTKATRDGGRDIIAIYNHMNMKTKHIIECKRYAAANKVSIGIVQRLLGVKIAECANKAIVATTSTFTRDARNFANNHIWDLDLKDYDDILDWIKSY